MSHNKISNVQNRDCCGNVAKWATNQDDVRRLVVRATIMFVVRRHDHKQTCKWTKGEALRVTVVAGLGKALRSLRFGACHKEPCLIVVLASSGK